MPSFAPRNRLAFRKLRRLPNSSFLHAQPFLSASAWPSPGSSYYLFVVRPHFLPDYRYLFNANSYTGMAPSTVLAVLSKMDTDGLWTGEDFQPAPSLRSFSVLRLRVWFGNPLMPELLLPAACFAAFLSLITTTSNPGTTWSSEVPLPLLIPVSLLQPWGAQIIRTTTHNPESFKITHVRGLSQQVAVVLASLTLTLTLAKPSTTSAPQGLHLLCQRAANSADPPDYLVQLASSNPLILSISGSQPIPHDRPALHLRRLRHYGTCPSESTGGLLAPAGTSRLNQVEDDKMDALGP